MINLIRMYRPEIVDIRFFERPEEDPKKPKDVDRPNACSPARISNTGFVLEPFSRYVTGHRVSGTPDIATYDSNSDSIVLQAIDDEDPAIIFETPDFKDGAIDFEYEWKPSSPHIKATLQLTHDWYLKEDIDLAPGKGNVRFLAGPLTDRIIFVLATKNKTRGIVTGSGELTVNNIKVARPNGFTKEELSSPLNWKGTIPSYHADAITQLSYERNHSIYQPGRLTMEERTFYESIWSNTLNVNVDEISGLHYLRMDFDGPFWLTRFHGMLCLETGTWDVQGQPPVKHPSDNATIQERYDYVAICQKAFSLLRDATDLQYPEPKKTAPFNNFFPDVISSFSFLWRNYIPQRDLAHPKAATLDGLKFYAIQTAAREFDANVRAWTKDDKGALYHMEGLAFFKNGLPALRLTRSRVKEDNSGDEYLEYRYEHIFTTGETEVYKNGWPAPVTTKETDILKEFIQPLGTLTAKLMYSDPIYLAYYDYFRYFLEVVRTTVSVRDCINPSLTILQVFPSPFSSSATLTLSNALPSDSDVTITNSLGQKVATLRIGAGTQTVTWNGTDENGHRLPSGIYMYAMPVNGTIQTGKMVLSR